ncbi:tyrosine-protein kinase receptor-like [Ptychodera flava]|uniref:tyrosine-protein kinase receptor-like n=1 Tax=Ptychodera flava TaxID=63121 RepID=UPI00396A29B9
MAPCPCNDAAVGPLRDHSEESEQGHYILFSSYDMQNSTLPALFISPNYTMSGPQCLLNFRYQLSGDAAESLSVYVRTGKQEAVAWSVKGDQQNRWLEASIQIGMLNEPFQVVIKGILDSNTEDASYISVDSVSFLYCSPELPPLCSSQIVCRNEVCIGPDELCDINKDCLFGDDEDHDACAGMPESARCDFEDENMCGWFNEATDDDFDWKRHFGRTPTKNTGPSRDHTLGTDQGHYMYIEVSNPVQNGDKANFRSPVFPSPPADNWMSGDRYESCKLRFHYHIYGTLLGLLRVFAVQNDTAETTSRLWQSPYSADDDIWVKATIPITENVQDWYYIQFEASRGLHHEGDIAIDDVSLSPECFGIWPSRVTSPSPTSRATSSVTVKATSQITRLSPAFSGSTYTFITSEPPTPPTTNATQFIFTPCSAMGMNGPSQAQCNSAYMYSSVTVRVLQTLPYKGIQVWTVPTSAFYSISAKGGGGGTGVQNNGPSKGAKVEGVFYLESGEKIYLLVGHRGAGACETTSAISKSYCDGSVSDSERSKIGPNGPRLGGGGGACSSGGGGGGYTGGDAAPVKSSDINGKGGTSYVHESAQHVNLVSGENAGDGQVMMTIVPECLQDEQLSLDRTSCVKVDKTKSPGALISVNVLTAIVLIVFVFVVVVLGIAIFLVKRRKHKKFDVTYDLTDYQLEQLRQTAVMDFNPNYVLVDGVSKLQDLNEVPRENLQLISALGHGAFGEVYKGTFQIPGKIQEISVAVKTLPELSTQQDELDFIMEALILTKFNHPNIVECVGVCFTQTPRFIVLELMQGGELRDFLRENRPTRDKETILKMVDLLNIAMDITKGCEYLETERFIHRDIAARNILLSSKGPDRIAKIGDFGMARNIYRNDYYRKGGKAMLPVKWMPPEAYLDGIFTSKTDVWSFGVLLWELMSLGYMPYPGMTNQEVMQYVAQGERMHPPRNCPMPVYRIMTQCWQDLPENRPPFKTIKERVGYCLQDPDVLETPLPLSAVSESDVKRQSTIIRPSNLKARAAIDTQQFRRPSDINTAPTSLNCSQDSVLGPANVHPGSASHDQLSAYHTQPQSDPGYIRLANSAGSLSKFPDSGADETVLKDRGSDVVQNGSCGTVTSERRAPSSADSELSANELTDLIKTKQATADSNRESTGQSEPNRTPLFTQHDCDIDPKSNDN